MDETRPPAFPGSGGRRVLYLALALALLIRLPLVLVQDAASMDQVLYCNDARNLAEGRWGYVFTNANNFYVVQESGLSTYNHPLYPVIMALVSLVTRDIELAGWLISLAAGLLSLVAIHWLARRLLGPPWAAAAVLLAAVHPGLAMASATKYSEATFIFLMLLSACMLVRLVDAGRWPHALASGVLLGLAYLVKPEAGVITPAFVLIALLGVSRTTGNWRRGAAVAALIWAASAATALPYRLYFLAETGEWKKGGKSLYNYIAAERQREFGHARAFWELNDDATDTILSVRTGTENLRDLLIRDAAVIPGRMIDKAFDILAAMAPPVGRVFAALFIAASIGALISAWRRRAPERWTLSALGLVFFLHLAPFALVSLHSRSAVSLVPTALLSVLAVAAYWSHRLRGPLARFRMAAGIAAAVVFVLGWFAFQLPKALLFVQASEDLKPAGEWIAANTPPDTVLMARSPGSPYYARRRQVILPEETAARIHHYALHRGATYVVTEAHEESEVDGRPDLFELVHETGEDRRKVSVYRIQRP